TIVLHPDRHSFPTRRSSDLATGLAFLLASALGSSARAGGGIAFGHAVVVDHQRVTGEPSLSISPTTNTSGHHDVYVSAPYGFSTDRKSTRLNSSHVASSYAV